MKDEEVLSSKTIKDVCEACGVTREMCAAAIVELSKRGISGAKAGKMLRDTLIKIKGKFCMCDICKHMDGCSIREQLQGEGNGLEPTWQCSAFKKQEGENE